MCTLIFPGWEMSSALAGSGSGRVSAIVAAETWEQRLGERKQLT